MSILFFALIALIVTPNVPINVSKIAKSLGGGGHRNASGLSKKGYHNTII